MGYGSAVEEVMMAAKTKRKFIDWDSIEPLYRAGSLSLNDICRQYEADHINSQVWKKSVTHAAIIKQAKTKKWTRNLADKVKARIKEKLVTSSVTPCNQNKTGVSDDEIVEKAAEVGSNVIIRHRTEIAALLEQEEQLLKELLDGPTKLYMANFQGEIISQEVGLTVKERSATLKDLAAVRAQRIALEREAHNLNNDNGSTGNDILLRQMLEAMPTSIRETVKEKLRIGIS